MDHQGRRQLASPEVALANEVFDQFCNAATLKSILGHYRHLCDLLKLKPSNFNQFYPKLKSKLRSWKAQALWKKFDQRANHKCYNRGKACPNTRVLIIGGGPCGLRSAIEAQLLGAKVVVVEKRDRMSRNNVLHLWPFVIHDLRALGAKKFFGKFCAGSIDHISIRQLQCILLKVSLILGVEFHENISFDSLIEPPEDQTDGKIGWRAKTVPVDHPVSQYEFDVLIGADGKRNTLEGFKRKEFRGKLAIAITANFINKRTEAEARVEEISGVAFIFNQKFFKELHHETGIDLENIVYYKDETHYFVMTAKKHSLIDKGVILQDHQDTAKLLAKENVDREALMQYAREAAEFSTEYQMMDMEFAVNHYGQPDVAMFDFTSMYAAENASRVVERRGHRLLMCLVGDSLLEPFWPTGSGCARGFLSSLDACWTIKGFASGTTSLLQIIAERESIYRLLGQTTPENLNRDYAAYTLDPHTRYPNLNNRSVLPVQVTSQLDTDDPASFKQIPFQATVEFPKKRRRRDTQIHPDTLLHWLQRQVALYDQVRIHDMSNSFKSGLAIAAIIHRYRPDLLDFNGLKKDDPVATNQLVFDILEKELGIAPIMTGLEMVECEAPDNLAMFSYLTQIYESFRGEIPHIKHSKLEYEIEDRTSFSQKLSHLVVRTKKSRHFNESLSAPSERKVDSITRRAKKRRSSEKMGASVDKESKIHISHIRDNVGEAFSGRIKNFEEKLKNVIVASEKKPKDLLRAIGKIEKTDWNVKEIEKKIEESKMGRGIRQDKIERVPKWSREQFLARQTKMEKKGKEPAEVDSKYAEIDNTIKSIDKKMKEGNILGHNKVSAMAEQFASKSQDTDAKIQKSNSKTAIVLPAQGGSEICHFCNKRVYLMERVTAEGKSFHRGCFRCEYCSTSLRIGNHTFDRDKNGGRFYCVQHFGLKGTIKSRNDKQKITAVKKENHSRSSDHLKISNKISMEGVVGLDLIDRGETPERIEFENLAGISDPEEAHSQMDEDEWTDRNFGPSAAEMCSSDEISGMSSDSDDDNEIFEEAVEQPLTAEGTLKLAKNWTLRYSHPHPQVTHSDTGSNEYEDSSDDYSSTEEENESGSDDEEDARAREVRKKEVWLQLPLQITDTETGSETEVATSNESTDSTKSGENSETEISTDSEFDHDGLTPTKVEVPQICINDAFVRKTRGDYIAPKNCQLKKQVISPVNKDTLKKNENVKLISANQKQETIKESPLTNPRKGDYLLSRTHSTEGIASKLSLELKKKYLLGNSGHSGAVIKSISTSNVIDTKLKSLQDSISQHQKLLNPAPKSSLVTKNYLQSTNYNTPPTNNRQVTNPSLVSNTLTTVFSHEKSFKNNQLPDLIKETSGIVEASGDFTVNDNVEISSVVEIMKDQNAVKEINDENIESDCIRPRSPLHETSILVPQVFWEQNKNDIEKDQTSDTCSDDSKIDTDSLSTTDDEENDSDENNEENEKKINLTPPRLQIHSTDGYLLLDEQVNRKTLSDSFDPDSIECSSNPNSSNKISFASDQVMLLNADEMETVNYNLKMLQLQQDKLQNESNISKCNSPLSVSSKSEENDVTSTGNFTETEVSEWARDGEALVSKELEDVEYSINAKSIITPSQKGAIILANCEDLTDAESEHQVSGKNTILNQTSIASKMFTNSDDIGFMDTDNESVIEDSLKNDKTNNFSKNLGYVEFVDIQVGDNKKCAPIANMEMDIADKCYNDKINKDVNALAFNQFTNEDITQNLVGSSINKSFDHLFISPYDNYETELEKNCDKNSEGPIHNEELMSLSMEEDSLLIVDKNEDTTQSEITNTILASPISSGISNFVNDKNVTNKCNEYSDSNTDYLEYVKRLQCRIAEFSNAKDSIDIRKSKGKNSKILVQDKKSEIIVEEIKNDLNPLTNSSSSPGIARKLEEITKERSKQKTYIQGLLIDKIEAQKQKSAEKKAKRSIRTASFSVSPLKPPPSPPKSLTSLNTTPENSYAHSGVSETNKPMFSQIQKSVSDTKKYTCNDNANLTADNPCSYDGKQMFKASETTPKKVKHEEFKRREKEKENANAKIRFEDNANLSLTTEEKLNDLKIKIARRRLVIDDSNKIDACEKKVKRYSFGLTKSLGSKLQTSKSSDNVKASSKHISTHAAIGKSLDELLQNAKDDHVKRKEKKHKDPERRKSIIQAVSDFFKKKDSSPSSKQKTSKFTKLTPKSKDKIKLFKSYSDESNIDKISPILKERPRSICEGMLNSFIYENSVLKQGEHTLCQSASNSSEDSFSENETKLPSSSTFSTDKTETMHRSGHSNSRKLKAAKRLTRQVQLKRLRMAQEIQRKLEETEVKQRELENRGIAVEKVLRGEDELNGKGESELLLEWFNLTREVSNIRRFENELLVHAQELQLEDRHDRLQQELHERLANDDKTKTSEDVKKEGEILTEMLEIVAKRDSLIALLEEERQRYQEEDRNMESQILARGLKLSSLKACGSTKYSF